MRYWLYALAVLLLAACNSGERQRLQLEELERQNRADSLMLNDSLARDLADWFDRHGTPNEQMRAYYILGRTYADRGETPAALEAYHDAIDHADTIAADCNYYTLCRVYSQMAVLFFRQNLLNEDLRCLDKSIHYAYLAGDTIAAINSYAQKADAYELLGMPDSVIANCQKTFLHPEIFNDYMAMVSNAYIMKGDLINARRCLDVYERKSGYFDDKGNIESGREAYYDIKGTLYYKSAQYDSAEYYFRKELQKGLGYTFQNMASRSLSLLFEKTGKADSAAKYAIYSYETNDSDYAQMTTETLARMQTMYDYSCHQRVAEQAEKRAEQERLHVLALLAVIAALSFVGVYASLKVKRSRRFARERYYAKIKELANVQSDVLSLRSSEEELCCLIREKEIKLNQLNKELSALRKRHFSSANDSESQLVSSPLFQTLQNKAVHGEKMSDKDWTELNQLVIDLLPGFYEFVMSEQYKLTVSEYRTLLLLRLHISPKPISYMLGYTPQNITRLSKSVLQKVFGIDGNSSVLVALIVKIH